MELKPGYKQTEIGVMPEDWTAISIGDVSRIFGRIGFRGYTINDIVKEGNGAITISPSNIQGDKTNFSNCTYISWRKYEESPEIKIDNGDILLVKTGSTVGKTAIVKNLPERATINPQIVVLKKLKVNNVFLGYSMGFKAVQDQLSATVVGGALPTLSQAQIAKFKFYLPPTKAEQESIAEALSDTDALIESLEQLIAKKRQLKQGAMQELLTGKMRLPGFGNGKQSYQQTKFGMMPPDWTPTPLKQVSSFITKGSTPTTYGFSWQNDGVLFLRSECVAEHGLDLSQSMFISNAAHQFLRRSEVQSGDILMTITGNVGRVILLGNDLSTANINQHIARIRINNDQIAATFLFHFLSQPMVRRYYNLITTGQAYPQISLTQVRETEVPMPQFDEQIAIAEILSDMDTEIVALEAKLAKARNLKQGMMQELLTGRIRLL